MRKARMTQDDTFWTKFVKKFWNSGLAEAFIESGMVFISVHPAASHTASTTELLARR
jgi:hypothetical protein